MSIEKKILNALCDIPLIKDGKLGIVELQSFHSDVKMLHKMKNMMNLFPENNKLYLKEWKNYIKLRNDENFISHSESKNDYNSFFENN